MCCVGRRMKKYTIVATTLIFLCMILLFSEKTSAYTGAFCEGTNFCTCGAACTGGYEFSNLFNTIDGCPDGPDYNYESVENISIEVLNSQTFKTGKTAEITAEFKISLGDQYLILYNNGSGFYPVLLGNATVDGFETIKVNKTLDVIVGNHTLRAIIYYPENSQYTNQTCGYLIDNYYSDTDDITFNVESGDSTPPNITSVSPQGESFLFDDSINISANLSDDDLIGEVYANITIPDGSTRKIVMTFFENRSNATFYDLDFIGRYNFTIFAVDDSQNVANETGYFFVDHVINITFESPIDGRYYDIIEMDFNLSVIDENYTIDTVRFEFNNASDNASNTTIFPLENSTRYWRLINISSNNTIKVYVNNSAGISKTEEIVFYYDNTTPSLDSVEFGESVEYGEYEFIRVSLVDDHRVDSCLLEIDLQNITMNRENALTFNYSYLAEQGPREFKIHFNDSMNHKNSTGAFYFYVNDTAPPVISSIQYSPNLTDDTDPNITISVSANITDSGSITNATLFFAESEGDLADSNNTNRVEMTLTGGVYLANFTPENESIYYFKITAQDEFGNYNSSVNFSINSSYDRTFTITPASLGAIGCIMGENVSLGNFTINNTGDFNLGMSIYKSADTAPSPEFSEANPIIVPKDEQVISVYAMCPLIESAYEVVIIANDTSTSTTEEITSLLVAQKGGPYAAMEFINYPQSSTGGSARNNFTIKITNVGNETAENISFEWNLPSGWSTRENTSLNISSLEVGHYLTSTIYVLIPADAASGDYIVSATTQWGNASSQSQKRISVVAINPPAPQATGATTQTTSSPTTTIKRTSSGSAIAPLFNELKFNMAIGKQTTFEMNLTNNNKYLVWTNFQVQLEGFPANKFIIRQDDVEEVKYKMMKRIYFDFDIPSYSKEERKTIKIIITAQQFDEKINLTSEVTFKRDVDIIIQRGELQKSCVDFAEEDITAFENLGAASDKLRLDLEDARLKIENGDLESARKICMAIKDERTLAEEASLRISLIEEQISGLRKEYYDTFDLERAVEDAKHLFKSGMISSSLQSIENIAQMSAIEKSAYEYSVKRVGKKLFIDYWSELIIASLLTSLVGSIGYSKGRRTLIKIKKARYLVEEKKILELMKKTQKEYYEDKIMGSDLYHQEMNQYRQDMARIVGKKVEIIIYEFIELNHDYFNAKRTIKTMIEELQEMRFVTKEMGEESYSKILAILSDKASEIDEKQRGAALA